ncbi:hypothetical protein PIROE2DRAFT_15529, partial [Piromyces sp. E2]
INKFSDKNSVKDSPTTNTDSNVQGKKATYQSQNSLVSYTYSEDLSTTSGMGKETFNDSKICASNQKTSKKYVDIIILTAFSVNTIKDYASEINTNINIPCAISQSALNVRLLSYNLILNDYRDYGKHINMLKNTLLYLDVINMVSVNEEMGDLEPDGSLIVPVGSYSYDSFESLSLSESYNKMVSYLKYCINRGKYKY